MEFTKVMDFTTVFALIITFIAVITVFKGADRTLEPGLNFLIPYIESIPYKHTLKEYAMECRNKRRSRATTSLCCLTALFT